MARKKYSFYSSVFQDHEQNGHKVKNIQNLLKFWSRYLNEKNIGDLKILLYELKELTEDFDWHELHKDIYLLYGYAKWTKEFYEHDLKQIEKAIQAINASQTCAIYLTEEGGLFGKSPGETHIDLILTSLEVIKSELHQKIYGSHKKKKSRTKNSYLETVEFRLVALFGNNLNVETDRVEIAAYLTSKLCFIMGYNPLFKSLDAVTGEGLLERFQSYVKKDEPYEDPIGFERSTPYHVESKVSTL